MYNRKMVDEMRICIICLRTDKKLRDFDKRLSEHHDILCDFTLNILEPRYCFECEHLLRRAYIFHRKCVKAVKVFNDWQRKKQADKEPIDVIHTLLPSPFQSSLGPWIPSSPNVQFALYTETLSEVTSPTPLTKLHPETAPPIRQPTNAIITKATTASLNEENVQSKDIPRTNVKRYQPDGSKVEPLDFNMSLSVNALGFPLKSNTKLTDINQEFNKKQPIVLAQRLTMDALRSGVKVNQKTMDILLKTKSLENKSNFDLNISNDYNVNEDEKSAHLQKKTELNCVDYMNMENDDDFKIAEDDGCLFHDFLDDDILNDDINDIESDVEIDTECVADDTNDELNNDRNKITDELDSVKSENEIHGELDCVQSEMKMKNNDFDIDVSDEDILLSSEESNHEEDIKLTKVNNSKTKGIGRRTLDRRSLLAVIKAKFKASGELKTKDGTTLDKEYILRCLQDRAPDAIWYRLDLRLRHKSLTYGAINALYFVQTWYKTNDSIPNCEIEYFNTEEKVRAEFGRRKDYECYKQAKFKCEICYRPFRHKMSLHSHMKYHNTDSKDDLVCSICKWRHKKRKCFMLHRRNHDALYKCKICIMRTYHRPDMLYHAEKHLGATYACQFCGVVYKWKSHLGKHMALVHPRSFVCTVCGDGYRTSDRLEEHRLKHQIEGTNGTNAVKCDKCDLSFPTEKVYKKHYYISHKPTAYHRKYPLENNCDPNTERSIKTGEVRVRNKRAYKPLTEEEKLSKQIECRLCGAVGMYYSWLAYHFKAEHPIENINVIYADKKPHLCEACGKGFSSKYSLRDHMNKHWGVRPYACPDCPQRFYSALYLRNHSLLHLPEKQHMCNVCGKLFRSKPNLYTHERIHTQDRRYKCNICSKTFLHPTTLKEHIRGVHYNLKRVKKPKAKNNGVKRVIEGRTETISDAKGVETVEEENIRFDLKDDKSEWGEKGAADEAAIDDGVIPGRSLKGVLRVWSDEKGVKSGRSDIVTKGSRRNGVKRVRADSYIDEEEGIRDDSIGELTEETDGDEVTHRWASDVSIIKEVTSDQPKYTVVRVKRGEPKAGTSSKGVPRGKKVNVDWDKRRRVSTVYEYSDCSD